METVEPKVWKLRGS